MKFNIPFRKHKNNTKQKRNFIIPQYIFILVLHLPFVFAKNKPVTELKLQALPAQNYFPVDSSVTNNNSEPVTKFSVYDSLKLKQMGLPEQTFNYAIRGFNYLVAKGKLADNNIISIIDFSLPSTVKRLFVIDKKRYKVLYCTYVAHGVNSGKEYAKRFSNKLQSNQSSLGFYKTENTYQGGNGYSLKLEGLEKGINDNAMRRDIVIHGADYVDESLIKSQGYLGRSLGCPALPQRLHKPIINKIKNGTCLFIYSADKSYLNRSGILNAGSQDAVVFNRR